MSRESERAWWQVAHAFFVQDENARRGAELLLRRHGPGGRLERLLRHHGEEEISDGETWERDYVDYLLAFFAMTEVAYLSGFIDDSFEPGAALARFALGNAALGKYYTKHYPLLLPQAHYLRSVGMPLRRDPDVHARGPALFGRFFGMSYPIETGSAVETFLWFLDDGSRGGYDLDDTIEALSRIDSFVACMADRPGSEPEGEEWVSLAVQGFVTFLAFASRLLDLLEQMEELPVLRSAMWHYHGYWFSRMQGPWRPRLERALKSLRAWHDEVPEEDHADGMLDGPDGYLRVIERLGSQDFSEELRLRMLANRAPERDAREAARQLDVVAPSLAGLQLDAKAWASVARTAGAE